MLFICCCNFAYAKTMIIEVLIYIFYSLIDNNINIETRQQGSEAVGQQATK